MTRVNNCNGEPINVSRQRLSKASPLKTYSGKLRCRCQIHRSTSNHNRITSPPAGTPTLVEQQTQDSGVSTTLRRPVQKPARFLFVADHMAGQNKEGEVVETEGGNTREP